MTDFGDSTGFWLAASVMIGGIAAMLILSLIAARGRPGEAANRADLALYREQLAGIERDLGAGVIASPEATRLKTEIARRLLEADRRATDIAPRQTTKRRALILPILGIFLALGGGVLLYMRLGAPGLPDLPLAERIAAADQRIAARMDQASFLATLPAPPPAQPDAEFAELMEKLRAGVDPAVSQDLTGLQLLARNEAFLGNYTPARAAQTRILALKGADASAEDHATLADILIREAGGYVSPEAETELKNALAQDPKNGLAQYYLGLIFAQGGRFDQAFAIWRTLLSQSAADAPWTPALRQQITEVAMLAGVDFVAPAPPPAAAAALPGPDAEAMSEASTLSAQDQAAMVEAMVAQLSARLAEEGGSPEEWARLIHALGVQGRHDEALAVLSEARALFPSGAAQDTIEAAAQSLPKTEQEARP